MNLRKLLSRRRVVVVGVITIFALLLCGREAKAVKLAAPTWFGMERIADGIYVNKAMLAEQRVEMQKLVVEAKDRLARYYGSVKSRPDFYFYSTQESFES